MDEHLLAALLILGGYILVLGPLALIEHRDATGRAPWDR